MITNNAYYNQGGALGLESVSFTETTTVAKWGNSTGIRIPKKVIQELNIRVNDKLQGGVSDGKIILEKKSKNNLTLRERMEEFYQRPFDEIPMIKSEEVEWGTPKGDEIW